MAQILNVKNYIHLKMKNQVKIIWYIHNSYDDEGNLCIYAAIYNPIDEEKKLIPIEDDNEWAFVEEMIDTLQEGENEQYSFFFK